MYWVTIFPVDCIKSAMQTDTIVRAERKWVPLQSWACAWARWLFGVMLACGLEQAAGDRAP